MWRLLLVGISFALAVMWMPVDAAAKIRLHTAFRAGLDAGNVLQKHVAAQNSQDGFTRSPHTPLSNAEKKRRQEWDDRSRRAGDWRSEQGAQPKKDERKPERRPDGVRRPKMEAPAWLR